MKAIGLGAVVVCAAIAISQVQSRATVTGGHETDPRDHGRPVVLIAAALGVPTDVFRETFTHVRPAPGGEAPDPQQVRLNKDALLSRLSVYGVTNERLDEVSNYYRYRPQAGEMWPNRPARLLPIYRAKKLIGFKILDGGSGYSSVPAIFVDGKQVAAKVKLRFGQEFSKNGSIASITP